MIDEAIDICVWFSILSKNEDYFTDKWKWTSYRIMGANDGDFLFSFELAVYEELIC